MLGVTLDVTERKLAELALQQRTAQFETLLDQAPLGVYLVDADFRMREVNPSPAGVRRRPAALSAGTSRRSSTDCRRSAPRRDRPPVSSHAGDR